MADYRFVPSGGSAPYDADGTPAGQYYANDALDGEGNLVPGAVGMSKAQFASNATGATAENPWYLAPQNGSAWTNFRDTASGFLSSPGGQLISGPLIGAGLTSLGINPMDALTKLWGGGTPTIPGLNLDGGWDAYGGGPQPPITDPLENMRTPEDYAGTPPLAPNLRPQTPQNIMQNFGGSTDEFGNLLTDNFGASALSSPSFFDSAKSLFSDIGGLKGVNSALSFGSGIYGLYNAYQQKKLAQQMAAKADPWTTSGGRAVADTQLQELLKDPSAAAKNDPSYALRLQAASRGAAQYGEGSGKMAVDAANASTSWYNDRLQQLGGLAGANANPANAAEIALRGRGAADKFAGDSLATIGYGANAPSGIPPAMMQQMMLMMQQNLAGRGANP